MYRLLATAIFLLVVCGPRSIVGAETEVDIRSVLGEMEAKMLAHAEGNLNMMKQFMTESIVERLDGIEEILKHIQEKQTYFEHCVNASPCGHHGTCSAVGTEYKCTCKDGFEGEHCEVRNFCKDVECLNGGTCHELEMDDSETDEDTPHVEEYICVCDGTWYGDHCELKAPCAAALEKIDADAAGSPGEEKPLCEIDGFYAPVQYRGNLGYCVTTDGEEITGYRMRKRDVDEMSSCSCARDEHTAKSDGESGHDDGPGSFHHCAKNGNYAPFTCEEGTCYCQDTEGNVDKSSGVPQRMMRRRLNCPGMRKDRPGGY